LNTFIDIGTKCCSKLMEALNLHSLAVLGTDGSKETLLKTSGRSSERSSSGRRSSSKSSSGRRTSSARGSKNTKINIFVQTDFLGEKVTVNIDENKTIGEVKKALCTEHGVSADKFWLIDGDSGLPIDDNWGFQYFKKHGSNLSLAPRSGGGVSPKKRKPSKTLDAAVEATQYEEEVDEMDTSVKATSEDFETAVNSTLMKALTRGDVGLPLSGGYRVRELPSSKQAHREHEKKLAQGKAILNAHKHHIARDEAPQDLASQVSEGLQQLFPSMFFGCSPTIAKKQSFGGPAGAKPPNWAGA